MSITMHTELTLVPSSRPAARYLHIEVAAPERSTARRPVHVSLVLDRSGSMDGVKLTRAIDAAVLGVRSLQPQGCFSIVTFDDSVRTEVASTSATATACKQAIEQLRRLHSGGSTHLSSGWLTGCEQVATTLPDDAVGRVLLLTDGQANHGITDPDELVRHACELMQRRITTSTFGLGQDFNEQLLSRLATAGGGSFYYIESAAQIESCFAAELGEALEVVARDVTLTLTLPSGVRARVVSDVVAQVEAQGDGQVLALQLGSLISGQVFDLVIELELPKGRGDLACAAHCSDRDGTLDSSPITVCFARASRQACTAAELHLPVVDKVLAQLLANARRKALELARRHTPQAQAVLAEAITHLHDLGWERLAAVGQAIEQLQREQAELATLGEDERRLRHTASYATLRSRDPRGRAARRGETDVVLLDADGRAFQPLRELAAHPLVGMLQPAGRVEVDVLGWRFADPAGALSAQEEQGLIEQASLQHAHARRRLIVVPTPLAGGARYREMQGTTLLSLHDLAAPLQQAWISTALLAHLLQRQRDPLHGKGHTTLHACVFDPLAQISDVAAWLAQVRFCSGCKQKLAAHLPEAILDELRATCRAVREQSRALLAGASR